MSRALITDELRPDRVADVMVGGALETVPIYDYAYIPSATGSGIAVASACMLHTITIGQTGASGSWIVFADMEDTDSACPGTDTSAEKVAAVYGGTRKQYIVDAIIDHYLCYRLSGEHDSAAENPGCDGITITYKLI